jgi:C-terminal processing protease CtpA/Prc
MACAVAAKDYKLATLVGEETGEPVVSTGETYDTVAPVTGLRATFTTKVFFGPRPRPDRQGVLPDVRVVRTIADLRAGRDPVLARGIELALGTSS